MLLKVVTQGLVLVLISFVCPSVCKDDSENPLVHLSSGAVLGKEDIDENNNIFYSFLGIPYAEPPIGHLRFQPPIPKLPWDSVLQATKEGPHCPQMDMFTRKFIGQEDNCLVLNVYTPKIPVEGDDKKLDVLFHIHGGGFIIGNGGSELYGPKRLMQKDKNIIIVSINYRLSLLGFLSTEDDSSWGNYGLLDQVEALHWVHKNIDRFGGDPERVTIIGVSAGGASVSYLTLSPLTKGLFHRAISMSGSALSLWASQKEPLHWAKTVAKNVGCPHEDTKALIHCLRQKDAKELIENDMSSVNGLYHMVFTPTVDHHFILDTPYNIITQKRYNIVPLMAGVTKDEGDLWFKMPRRKPDNFDDTGISESIGSLFASISNTTKIVKLVKDKYLPTVKNLTIEEIHQQLSKFMTDVFHQDHYLTVKKLAATETPVYVYSYDYKSQAKGFELLFNLKEDLGVYHGADITMLFDNIYFGGSKYSKDFEVQKRLQKLFVNFAISGVPTTEGDIPSWPVSKPDEINVYHINSVDHISIHDETKDEYYKFWTEDVPDTIAKTIQPNVSNEKGTRFPCDFTKCFPFLFLFC